MSRPELTIVKPFIPTEEWHVDEAIDENTQHVIAEMNAIAPKQLFEDLKKEVKESPNGTRYAIMRGDNPNEYSETDALVMFNPFANTATPNMLVRAEFVRRVAEKEDITDHEGKLKPVIMLASPGINGSHLNLTAAERQSLRQGELGPSAEKMLKVVEAEEFGQVALLGYSLGADMVLAGARNAYPANLDLDSIAVGDPVGVEDRTRAKLITDFMKAPDLKGSVSRTGLDAQEKALNTKDLITFGLSAVGNSANRAYQSGMSKDTFEERAGQIIEENMYRKFIVGYGSDSLIAKPDSIEPALDNLSMGAFHNDFISVKINGGNHTWGDQLPLLAKLYMRAAI